MNLCRIRMVLVCVVAESVTLSSRVFAANEGPSAHVTMMAFFLL